MGQREHVCEHVTMSVVCAVCTVCAVVCVLAVGPRGPSLVLPPPWKEDAGRGQMVSSDPLFIIPAKAYSV